MSLPALSSAGLDFLHTDVCYHLLAPPDVNSTAASYPFLIFGDRIPLLDFIMFLPILLFALFLLVQIVTTVRKLKQTESIIMTTYYVFVWAVCIFNLVRTVIFAFVPHIKQYITIPFISSYAILVFIEVSVVIFMSHRYMVSGALAIKRTAIISLGIAFLNAGTQAGLIFGLGIQLFDHHAKKGAMYWVVRHGIFVVGYVTLLIIPCTRCRDALPARPAFYHYVRFLLVMNLAYVIGEVLVYVDFDLGFCFVIFSQFIYYAAFAPVLYFCFLFKMLREVMLPNKNQELFINGYMEGDQVPLINS